MIYLTLDDICHINRDMIRRFGGTYIEECHNLCNAGSLYYILEAIQYPLMGVDLYPTIIDKATALAWSIMTRHVFYDGNKRTGMEAALEFLETNGISTNFDRTVIDISVAAVIGSISLEDFREWIFTHVS